MTRNNRPHHAFLSVRAPAVRAAVLIALAGLLAQGAALAQPRETTRATPGTRMDLAKEVSTRTLANGLEIIVWPDHDMPNVAFYTWYRVGSRNERPGITGISHFFEHMMFNGSKNFPGSAFDKTLEAAGGSNNAYTTENVTVYQEWFPKSALETVFKLESDRICCLSLDSTSVANERGVVYSERRTTTDDNGEAALDEQVQAAAYTAHPYGMPVVGWPSDIEAWTQDDLRSWFRANYAPNNATMIVTGDVTPAEVFALAEKYVGPIPRQAPTPAVRTIEPAQQGERRVVLRRPSQAPYIQIAFHTDRQRDADYEALNLLSTILTGGESSRLYRRLVDRDRVAISVSDYFLRGFDPGLYRIYATVSPEKGLEACEAAILDELARVGRDGVTEPELRKAKKVALAGFWRRLATIDGKADALGDAELFRGDWRDVFSSPVRYERVTAKEIQTVARKLFDEKNRTVGVLIPENEPVAAAGKGGAR
jgi:zinc protease